MTPSPFLLTIIFSALAIGYSAYLLLKIGTSGPSSRQTHEYKCILPSHFSGSLEATLAHEAEDGWRVKEILTEERTIIYIVFERPLKY